MLYVVKLPFHNEDEILNPAYTKTQFLLFFFLVIYIFLLVKTEVVKLLVQFLILRYWKFTIFLISFWV